MTERRTGNDYENRTHLHVVDASDALRHYHEGNIPFSEQVRRIKRNERNFNIGVAAYYGLAGLLALATLVSSYNAEKNIDISTPQVRCERTQNSKLKITPPVKVEVEGVR